MKTTHFSDNHQLLSCAKNVLNIEAQAILTLSQQLDDSFIAACQLIYCTQGRVIVTGMGKSGHIGKKIAATLASTGTPAFFIHPAEAGHGDLGMVTKNDVVIAISNSGESDEILFMLPNLKYKGIQIIAITGESQSTLSQQADVKLIVLIKQEACPLNLTPTASTTAVLALGDALAVALLEKRGFKSEDFALSHPAGSLGRKLLIRVSDIMRQEEALPIVSPQTSIQKVLLEMSSKGMGMVIVLNQLAKIIGVFTDGDLRRTLDHDIDIRTVQVNEVMTPHPYCIAADRLASEALQLMQTRKINSLLVVKNDQLVGALTMHDLLRARII